MAAGRLIGDHRVEVVGSSADSYRKPELRTVPTGIAERRRVSPVEPGEQLLRRYQRNIARLRGIQKLRGERVTVVVVRAENSVVPFRAERLIEHAVDAVRVGDAVFIHEVRRRLVNVDDRAVEIGEAHGEARTGHEPRTVMNPFPRPIIVTLIEPDAMFEFHFRLRRPVAPRNTVGTIRFLRGEARVFSRERVEVLREEGLEGWGGPICAVRAYMRANLETLLLIRKRL